MNEEQEIQEAVIVFNHCGNDFGKKVEYQGVAYPDIYSLELKDGTVIDIAYPSFSRGHDGKIQQQPLNWMAMSVDLSTEEVKQDRLIENRDIAFVTLVESNGKFATLFASDAVARHRKNVAHAATFDAVNPNEDLDSIRPIRTRAMEISLTAHYVNHKNGKLESSELYPRIKCGGEDMTKQSDGTWGYERSCGFDLNPATARFPDPLKILKQLGVHVRLHTTLKWQITDAENIGRASTPSYELEIISEGRADRERINKIFTQAGLAFSGTLRFKREFKKEVKNEEA